MEWPFESRRANIGFILALVILVAISLDSYRTVLRFERTSTWRAQAHETIRTLSGILALVGRAESDRRGYIITGKTDYIKSYLDARQEIPSEVAKARSLVARDRVQRELLQSLDPLIAQEIANLDESIELLKSGKSDPATQIALTEKGRMVMDHIRGTINQMVLAQTEELGRRDAEMRSGAGLSILVTAMGDALSFGLLIFVFLLLNREIAQRRRNQEVIRGLNEDLERRATELANANKELEAFAYSVSHDLRAPLQSIELSMTLLEDEKESLRAEFQDYLRRIRTASQRMAELIQSLLRLSKIALTELRREPADLSDMARMIGGQLQKEHPGRTVDLAVSPGITVNADPALLRVVMENLLSNAWKFTGEQPAARIEVGAETREGEERVYFIRDNGAGFDMAKAGRLFMPFQRLHAQDQFEGIGIGLATVQRIIQKHGGRIWAEAAPEKGATFYFTLP